MAAVLMAASRCSAAYTLTKLADNTGTFTSFTAPVINNNGQVGFGAAQQGTSGGNYFIYDRATAQSAFIFNQPSVLTPQMADNGELAWQFNAGGGNTTVRKGSPGNVTLIGSTPSVVNGLPLGGFNDSPVVNKDGDVSYVAALATGTQGYAGLYKEQGANPVTFFNTDTGPGASDGSFFQYRPDVNDNDQIAYMGNRDSSAGGGQALWLWSKSGNTTDELDSGPASTFFFGPSINEAGEVAYTRSNNSVWVTQKGSTPQLYTTASAVGQVNIGFLTINNLNQVAFNTNNGGGVETIYVQSGPSATPVRVIGSGDTFDGSKIDSMFFSRGAFDDAGDIVVGVFLHDGRQELLLAQVPEPSSAVLCGFICLRWFARRRR
ncbi:MAG TPA: hypothetical protein VHS31_19750 [Tepidisphaeraceae bacterium]|nr:hypothetical protein [Tepidisphaeraceae bacterium]